MSSYYEYRNVKVAMAIALMNMDGWKVYGFHEDNSDPMTDYYDPAYWDGIAEKNGYVLCVDVHCAREASEIREYDHKNFTYDKTISDKIAKLEQMTMERGASEQEEESAKKMIQRLREKAEQSSENAQKYYKVIGVVPKHMENPPRMNWHIEKDGVYVAKGNGILKFSSVANYLTIWKDDMDSFRKDKEAYRQQIIRREMWRCNSTEEEAKKQAGYKIENMENMLILVKQFEELVNRFNAICGSSIGKGDLVTYEKVKVTEYKKENKAVKTAHGSIKEGQCFILNTDFSHNCYKGLVYRIHKSEYGDHYYANKLNGKLTKECTGMASSNNYWTMPNSEKFMSWIEREAISWCEIQEVKTPYEVEKVIKKVTKKDQTAEATENSTETANDNKYTYVVSEDVDTRNNEKIFLVKIQEKLDRDEYINVNRYMKSLGGYYSKFKHAFLFRENPSEKLNIKNA